MGFSGYVLVNGSPRWNAPVTINGATTINGAMTVNAAMLANNFQTVGTGGSFYVGGRSGMLSSADGTIAFTDFAASTFATAIVKDAMFMQPASTFAATATMTNGPRAANPIAWVECKVGGSSGRIPIW